VDACRPSYHLPETPSYIIRFCPPRRAKASACLEEGITGTRLPARADARPPSRERYGERRSCRCPRQMRLRRLLDRYLSRRRLPDDFTNKHRRGTEDEKIRFTTIPIYPSPEFHRENRATSSAMLRLRDEMLSSYAPFLPPLPARSASTPCLPVPHAHLPLACCFRSSSPSRLRMPRKTPPVVSAIALVTEHAPLWKTEPPQRRYVAYVYCRYIALRKYYAT